MGRLVSAMPARMVPAVNTIDAVRRSASRTEVKASERTG
jgi:hypothetical protein